MKCFLTVARKPLQSNVLLIMKLTALFTLFLTLNVSANGFGQDKININAKKTEISGILQAIEKQTTYRFLYNNNLQGMRDKVSLTVSDATLDQVMQLLLAKTKLLYQMMNNNLIVIKEDPARVSAFVQVRGKITGEGGVALAGVSVQVKGSTVGTTTNADGEFTINVPDENSTLVISSVGYDIQEVALAGRTEIAVALVTAAKAIEQVVVIGYGTANKRDLTGSIATVKAKDIADKPATNPLSLLQGKVSGLSIVNSGRVGSEPDVRIRGTNTVNGLKPVYIVDGILNDNINFLNPADIESIEVLKDPSSLAIFGVRGANGAIAVTTKKAKAGQLLVNFNTVFGVKHVVNKMKLTNAAQFKELYNEQRANMGLAAYDYTNWTGNTDWQDEIFQNGTLNYNNISITGATEKNRFYLGLGYVNEEGVIKHEEYRKYTLNFSDELRVTKGLRFGVTMNAYRAELPVNKDVGGALRAAPIAPIYDPNGSGLFHTLPSFQRAQVFNPLLDVETQRGLTIAREYRAVGSIYGEVDFLKHFNFRAQLFADYGFNTSRSYSPVLVVYNPDITGSANPGKFDSTSKKTAVAQSQNIYPKTQMDYLLTYKNSFGDHNLTVLAGITTYYSSYEATNSSVQQGTALLIPNDPDKWYVNQVGDQATRLGGGDAWEDASISYLARALYSFKGKYLLNASFRRDGSSQFYKLNNQWKNFGAVGAGWIVSQEDFFNNVKFLNYLKLKGSWGVLGNKNIGDLYRYPAYPTLSGSSSGVFGDQVIAALTPEYIPDPNLNWETVTAWEAGFELRALNNRLSFEAVYY
ncbi:MAG: SusC/RagA family TonB-linked outer membrane protein, partial [Pedobacter sp.]